jgi:hypothetical protein
MNRYFKLYRASMKRLAKMETILEEVYIEEPGPVLVLDDWKKTWHSAREHDPYESHWDQWVDIEYADEPSTSPPPMYKITTA